MSGKLFNNIFASQKKIYLHNICRKGYRASLNYVDMCLQKTFNGYGERKAHSRRRIASGVCSWAGYCAGGQPASCWSTGPSLSLVRGYAPEQPTSPDTHVRCRTACVAPPRTGSSQQRYRPAVEKAVVKIINVT